MFQEFEEKLARWKELHEELCEAQTRLRMLGADAARKHVAVLYERIAILKEECNQAFEEVKKATEAHKSEMRRFQNRT
jgi:hypothetical protein